MKQRRRGLRPSLWLCLFALCGGCSLFADEFMTFDRAAPPLLAAPLSVPH